jgi:hypothetical protein
MDDLGPDNLATEMSTPEVCTQVECTPLSDTRNSETPALRELTNTQESLDHREQLSQELGNMPGFSQSSNGVCVGFTQVPTSPSASGKQERAGKVSVVLESENRAFTVLDVLQAVRAALQDVKGSAWWVFDGLHKTSAAGKQPIVYETVFML